MRDDDLRPTWNGEEWTISLALAAWNAEAVEVLFLAPEDDRRAPPKANQVIALRGFLERGPEIRHTVLAAVLAHYEAIRPRYIGFLEDPSRTMPQRPSAERLAHLLELQVLYVHRVVREDRAYLGLQFRASWEIEHGLGLLLHGDRVVDIGDADTAFVGWNAAEDARKQQR